VSRGTGNNWDVARFAAAFSAFLSGGLGWAAEHADAVALLAANDVFTAAAPAPDGEASEGGGEGEGEEEDEEDEEGDEGSADEGAEGEAAAPRGEPADENAAAAAAAASAAAVTGKRAREGDDADGPSKVARTDD